MRSILRSIGFRISGTCWLVTLLTLGIYVAFNLPQQKRDLLEALESKARGVSSSLQDVSAGAAISEDYSTLVDHCVQVLRGDEAIEYLVITRKDGFSVMVNRSGWQTGTLDKFWRPEGQDHLATIAHVDFVGKDVFHYSRPLEYSAIRWGWVNVGLSTQAYNQSVTRVEVRAAWLALVGAVTSLFISFRQARRLVRPIVTLQNVVRQVAQGDLSARANLQTGDEVEDLAQSFNLMADTIMGRNRILESVRFAGQELLSADDWTGIVAEVLAKMGNAARVSRAWLVENHTPSGGLNCSSMRYQWSAPGVEGTLPKWQKFVWDFPSSEEWSERLRGGGEVINDPRDGACWMLQSRDPSILSFILVPIHVGDSWWGLLGMENCERVLPWSQAEKDSLRAVAGMFGAAIARQRSSNALINARNHLEQRVQERTHELQMEITAKQEANARLAEAQQRLMTLSRQAGMAEVATGVLHNVGNVLNSVNVSAGIVAGRLRESRIGNLLALTSLLEEHSNDLCRFLSSDPKGQRVLPYLSKLGGHLEEERRVMSREIDSLTGHIGHIKEIVSTQQSYAKVSGVIEIVSLVDLVEDAIHIVEPSLDRHRIQVVRNFETVEPVAVDKHLIMQILLNLLQNAKQAVQEANQPNPFIRIRIARIPQDRIQVSVTDTGVGIPAENLTRIFSHGFTTRRDGHGFGLHSGANAARQMGGSLSAESSGPGCGATFVLELPVNLRKTSDANNQSALATV